MKKNGFMVYELVISFALTFAILLVIFNTSISLNKKLSSLYVKNKISSKQIIINKKLGIDFTSKKIARVNKTDNSCEIVYENGTTITVQINNNPNNKYISFTTDGKTEKITFDDEINISDIEVCSTSQIKIPIKYLDDTIDYGIDLYNFISS